MKYQTLRIIASCLWILSWVIIAAGVVISVIIGIGASTAAAKIGFLLGGFVCTSLFGLLFMAASKLILLFIDIEEDLNHIIDKTDKDSD
jgi:hypothetical protein